MNGFCYNGKMKTIDRLGKNVYLIGIKGAGMTGLAQILQGLGYGVGGSDISDSFFTDGILRRQGIPFREGFDSKNIPKDIDWAVSSTAYLYEAENIEIKVLKERGVPIFSYPEALGYFFNQCLGIAITGTHGKSTTAGMIAYILEQAGKDPFALIGGELLNWRSNARIPKNNTKYQILNTKYFLIEADEYREQFLHYKPNVLVITNVDYDHPDYFATPRAYRETFEKFKQQIKPGGVVIEGKNPALHVTRYTLHVIGDHNQQNAALAYKTCKRLGIEHATIVEALKNFRGLRRRLEKVGEHNGAIIIDDYAHHPREIEASLKALRTSHFLDGRLKSVNCKIIALFHPHTYSRTQTFLKEFAKTLTLADEIYLLDIYASAREKKGMVSSDDIVEEIQDLGRDAINLHTIENAVEYFKNYLKTGDIFVTMGAGDVFRVAYQLTRKS
ncbi:MAG: UDP-N-acetylmuramate--L-alanine ligase [Candidatus Portnoybacteria bacterium]|nr:UDP-N-acetylmuramate--L-alanine ligase [Candidatus Portnoybacteria bacterium]